MIKIQNKLYIFIGIISIINFFVITYIYYINMKKILKNKKQRTENKKYKLKYRK
jgi:large-conductance mechanosensitive channel